MVSMPASSAAAASSGENGKRLDEHALALLVAQSFDSIVARPVGPTQRHNPRQTTLCRISWRNTAIAGCVTCHQNSPSVFFERA